MRAQLLKHGPVLVAIAMFAGVAIATADTFSIDWFTIDAGGITWATGGEYELGGTIGQAEAGTTSAGGGPPCPFELTGGFWFVVYPAVGDLNCDGLINFDDVNPFVLALTDVGEYNSRYPDCHRELADCNGDCYVDFGDIDPFVDLLSGN